MSFRTEKKMQRTPKYRHLDVCVYKHMEEKIAQKISPFTV